MAIAPSWPCASANTVCPALNSTAGLSEATVSAKLVAPSAVCLRATRTLPSSTDTTVWPLSSPVSVWRTEKRGKHGLPVLQAHFPSVAIQLYVGAGKRIELQGTALGVCHAFGVGQYRSELLPARGRIGLLENRLPTPEVPPQPSCPGHDDGQNHGGGLGGNGAQAA